MGRLWPGAHHHGIRASSSFPPLRGIILRSLPLYNSPWSTLGFQPDVTSVRYQPRANHLQPLPGPKPHCKGTSHTPRQAWGQAGATLHTPSPNSPVAGGDRGQGVHLGRRGEHMDDWKAACCSSHSPGNEAVPSPPSAPRSHSITARPGTLFGEQ